MERHLENIRVIDLTAYLAGPFVTLNLAAMGAEVIKIERPQIGDACRWNPPFSGPDGVSFSMKNDEDLYARFKKIEGFVGLTLVKTDHSPQANVIPLRQGGENTYNRAIRQKIEDEK